ncbi:FtsX-like permease family protein [Fructobacillus tropaeoli]|uniref:FtsX-like permease family protein n=1 Tax=Fructobacillus tropaeoli TaxID=709323 RepID=UPI001455E75A|nr:ABC transporter permease [Fructobacillus tropaeoli]NLS38611.1 FtsX-like permease family protein [Fructobacillus tropaeoli]
MLSLRFALQTLKKDFRHYALFIFANAFLLMVNAMFFAIRNNHSIATSEYGKIIKAVMVLGLVLSLLVGAVFIFYANSFVSGRRQRQIGTLSMLGMSRFQGFMVVAWQSLGLWFITTVIGLAASFGALFIAFPVLNQLAGGQDYRVAFDWNTVVTVGLIYAALFFMMTLIEGFKIGRTSLIDLTKSDQKVAKEPKAKAFLGITGFVILIAGYWLALTTKPSLNALFSFIWAVGLVIVGTYLVMIVGIGWLLKRLRKNQKYYYQDKHFVPVSGLLFRVKNNGAGLATVALLFTTIVVALTAAISMQQVTSKFGQYLPYDTTITSTQALSQDQLNQVQQSAQEHNLTLSASHELEATNAILANVSDEGKISRFTGTGDVMSTPAFRAMTTASLKKWQGQSVSLASDEVGIYATHQKQVPTKLQIGGKTYKVKTINQFTSPDSTAPSGPSYYYLVVNQQSQLNDFLKDVQVPASNDGGVQVSISDMPDAVTHLYAYDVKGTKKNEIAFSKDLSKIFQQTGGQVTDRADAVQSIETVFGSLVFVGVLTAVVLTFTTVLIVYYKQVAEGMVDRQNFKKMQRIGLSLAETKQMINRQIRLLFGLPLLLLVLNAAFAFPILKTVFKTLGMFDPTIFIPVMVTMTVIVILIYLVIYWLTSKRYQQIVNQ